MLSSKPNPFLFKSISRLWHHCAHLHTSLWVYQHTAVHKFNISNPGTFSLKSQISPKDETSTEDVLMRGILTCNRCYWKWFCTLREQRRERKLPVSVSSCRWIDWCWKHNRSSNTSPRCCLSPGLHVTANHLWLLEWGNSVYLCFRYLDIPVWCWIKETQRQTVCQIWY